MQKTTQENPEILLKLPLEELICRANEVRRKYLGTKLELCSILNAKSGLCSEDCKFCAQSAKNCSDVSVYPLKEKTEIVAAAWEAKKTGAQKFGIVTSGNRLTDEEAGVIAEAITQIRDEVDIVVCASLGALDVRQLRGLKEAGLSMYHHNIETSRRFYPQIVSTHSFDERIKTIKGAKEAGLSVCSGGIIGMGESWQDRIDMAYTLKGLGVDSVPINILVPIKGTALESAESVSAEDAIRTICIFRIVLKDKIIKIAAGREAGLKDSQITGFAAGANGMLIGGYLTIGGRDVAEDQRLVDQVKKLWTK